MNRLSSILLIQFVVTPAFAAPAFSATVIQAVQPQTTPLPVMARNPVPHEIKVVEPLQQSQLQPQFQFQLQLQKKNISTAKPVKPSTVSSMASGTVAYCLRRQEAQRKQRAQHHHALSQSQSQAAKPIQASKKQQATSLTGRIVHQEEVLQATTLPLAVAPRHIPPEVEVAEPVQTPSRQNQAEAKEIAESQKTEYGFGTWLKQLAHQLTHHKANPNTTEQGSSITEAQSAQLARSISAYVSELLPNSTYLLLAPPPKAQKHSPLTQALNDTLRQAGFRLVESKNQAQNAQVLQYQVSQLNDGVWLKVQLNQKEANRFYALNADESLAEDAPFSVREDKQ